LSGNKRKRGGGKIRGKPFCVSVTPRKEGKRGKEEGLITGLKNAKFGRGGQPLFNSAPQFPSVMSKETTTGGLDKEGYEY